MSTLHWMPLYIGDYLADTAMLTLEQSGAYLHLLMQSWRTGPLPDDDGKLAAITRTTRTHFARHIGPAIRPFFVSDNGRLRQPRLEAEREKQQKTSEKRAENARKFHEKRAENAPHVSNDIKGMACAGDPTKQVQMHIEPEPEPEIEKKGRKEDVANLAKNETAETAPAEPSPKPVSGASASPRGKRLPDDWTPSAEDRAFAEDHGLRPAVVSASFRDYWTAKPGAAARKTDWSATWRNWCRKDAERLQRRAPIQPRGKLAWMLDEAARPAAPGFDIEIPFGDVH